MIESSETFALHCVRMLAPQEEVSFSSRQCGLSLGVFEYLFMCPGNDSGHIL